MSARAFGRDRALAAGIALTALLLDAHALLQRGAQRLDLPNHDLFAEFLPRMHYAGAALARGEFPLWDPTQAAGLPFHATLQGGLLYPPNWLHALLPTPFALALLALAHLALAAVAAFALARDFGSSRAASALCGLAFGAGGSAVFAAYHPNAANALPWLPLQLLALRRVAREPGARNTALLALAIALHFLTGRDYAFALGAHATALLAAFETAALARASGTRAAFGFAAQLAASALLAGALVAAQLLPTLELAALSLRGFAGPEASQLESFGPYPGSLLFANLAYPAAGALRREYLGWIPLACFALSWGRVGRDRASSYATLLALFAVGIALGSATPLYAAYRALPLAGVFRLPDRALWLLALAVALGAARGFDLLFARSDPELARERRRALGLAAISGLALAAALASGALASALRGLWDADWGWTWFHGFEADHFRALASTALALVATAALFAACARSRAAAPRLRIALLAIAALDLWRALASPFTHPLRAPRLALAGEPCLERARASLGDGGRVLALRLPDSHAIEDKLGQLFGVASATHYDPLVTRRHALFFETLEGAAARFGPGSPATPFTGALTRIPPPARRPLLDLLGVRVILSDARNRDAERALAAQQPPLELRAECRVPTLHGPALVRIRANPSALPRAFVVPTVSRVSGPAEAAAAIGRADFDPLERAVVEVDALPGDLGDAAARALAATARASVARHLPDRVEIETESPRAALLVVTDTYFPGWSAEVNGAAAPIWPADVLFRGVPIPPGRARVSLRYEPGPFRIGAALSAAGVALAGALLWIGRARSQRSPTRRARPE
jgi:hypothetical protein